MLNATVVGHLGQDAEIKHTSAGSVTELRVAARYRADGEERTIWVRCAMWGKRGEALAPYLRTGTKVVATGPFSVHNFIYNGEARTSYELVVNDIEFAASKGADAKTVLVSPPGVAGAGALDDVPSELMAGPRQGGGVVDDEEPWATPSNAH